MLLGILLAQLAPATSKSGDLPGWVVPSATIVGAATAAIIGYLGLLKSKQIDADAGARRILAEQTRADEAVVRDLVAYLVPVIAAVDALFLNRRNPTVRVVSAQRVVATFDGFLNRVKQTDVPPALSSSQLSVVRVAEGYIKSRISLVERMSKETADYQSVTSNCAVCAALSRYEAYIHRKPLV